MSTYEKIATVALGILVIAMVIFSYRELREPPQYAQGPGAGPNFSESIGQDFKIGPFVSIVDEQSSGGLEANCDQLQPLIIGVLHDIKERLKHQKAYTGTEDTFEVNEATLQLLCNKNAEVTLADAAGNKLLLEKGPFVRMVPPQGTPVDIGTEVRINATVISVGAPTSTQPTTYGDVLIPDRFLDATSSSGY